MLVYGEFLNTSMLGVYSSGAANTTSRDIDSQYEVTGTYSIDSDYHSVLTLYSTTELYLAVIQGGTYIFTIETDTTGSTYVENISSTSFRIANDRFDFKEPLSEENENISITYSRSIDYSGAVISRGTIMATNYAYYLGATGTAVATYKISSVTNEEGLLSTGGRGDFVYAADGEHLNENAFKYLVLDAAGNSVYSKNSFIAAGEDGNIYTSAFCSQQSKTNLMVLATLTQSTGRNIIIEGFSLSNSTEPEYKFSTNIILYVNGDIDSAVDQVISSITNAINNRSYTKSNGQAINDSEHSGISSRWRGGAGNGISLMVLL